MILLTYTVGIGLACLARLSITLPTWAYDELFRGTAPPGNSTLEGRGRSHDTRHRRLTYPIVLQYFSKINLIGCLRNHVTLLWRCPRLVPCRNPSEGGGVD